MAAAAIIMKQGRATGIFQHRSGRKRRSRISSLRISRGDRSDEDRRPTLARPPRRGTPKFTGSVERRFPAARTRWILLLKGLFLPRDSCPAEDGKPARYAWRD